MGEGEKARSARPRILVLANDAGGANLLKSLIYVEKDLASWTVSTPADSPASRILNELEDIDHLDLEGPDPIAKIRSFRPDLVIFNPGWNSFPSEAIAGKDDLGFPTAAILDHWIDYDKRLNEDDADFFIVCDKYAFKTASEASLSTILKLNNYHLINLAKLGDHYNGLAQSAPDVLYISQTIGLHEDFKSGIDYDFTYHGLEEGKIIRQLLENFQDFSEQFQVTGIRFRLHPSETEFRHYQLVDKFPAIPTSIESSSSISLAESIANSRVVIGINSMAIYEAHLLGHPAFAIRPQPSTAINIPIPETQKLNRVTDADRNRLVTAEPNYYEEHPLHELLAIIRPGNRNK
ncbi:hypothetical protein OAK38_00330 [Verrucomicrobia bacterium]|nr:hypothetical protein [Verrucomicrobiota bacterium]